MQDNGEAENPEMAPAGAPQQPPRQPSIKDIARLAQVSHPTVSRALQNSPLVNPKTAEKIRRIAREAGYRPSAVARGLVTRRTHMIGLAVTSVSDPFTSEVVAGVEQAASDSGYRVLLADSNADPEREKKVVQAFAEQRVDGIIVTSSRVGALHMPLLREMMVPVVLVNDQHPGLAAHSVLIANLDGMHMLTEHLIALGHRRIGYIGDRFGYQTDTERLDGLQIALAEADTPARPEWIVHGSSTPESAVAAMNQLLDLPVPPTAVCCYNDMTALGALHAIRARRLRVPEDISITGFDDLFLAAYTDPPLTTIRQPMRRMGKLAVDNLVRLIGGESPVPQIRIPAELIIRASTAEVRT